MVGVTGGTGITTSSSVRVGAGSSSGISRLSISRSGYSTGGSAGCAGVVGAGATMAVGAVSV